MNDQNKILKGKNCFITGATGGIGTNVAEQMAASGCNMFLTSTNPAKLKKLSDRLRKRYNGKIRISYGAADLNHLADIQQVIQQARKDLRSIDIVINCAGVFPVKLVDRSGIGDFESCFNVNVRAPFMLAKEFAVDMKKRRWGRIVNIGSSSAYAGFKETALYCASKHAVLGLSRALHQELKEFGIRTFCVSPAAVKTNMGKKIKHQDFKTFIDPKDLASYISFVIAFNGDMVSDEVRLNRIKVQ